MLLDTTMVRCYPKQWLVGPEQRKLCWRYSSKSLWVGAEDVVVKLCGGPQIMGNVTPSTRPEGRTHFAPAQRAPIDIVRRQYQLVSDTALLQKLYSAVMGFILILNEERQIVFANRNLLDHLQVSDMEAILGLRPGEALQCVHAFEFQEGCGTTKFCRACGAVKSILLSQEGKQNVQECRIRQRGGGDALDLLVCSSPITLYEERFTILAVNDISHEKRRRVMERIFFHDLINTAVSLKLVSENLTKLIPDQWGRHCRLIATSVQQLIEEINSQRGLMAAEDGQLGVCPGIIDSLELLHELADLYAGNQLAKQRHILVDARSQRVSFESDRIVLMRVLGNMIKNALEACGPSEVVSLDCERLDNGVKFRVHNPGCMPEETCLQIFQRSFSTKGPDRGLGCYSMKLLTERYLQGDIGFDTSAGAGTTFFATYPLKLSFSG